MHGMVEKFIEGRLYSEQSFVWASLRVTVYHSFLPLLFLVVWVCGKEL